MDHSQHRLIYSQKVLVGKHVMGHLGVMVSARLTPQPLGCRGIKKETNPRKKKETAS